MELFTLTVSGMTGQHCVQVIKKSIAPISGIADCDISLSKKSMDVAVNDDADTDQVRERVIAAVNDAGYDVE